MKFVLNADDLQTHSTLNESEVTFEQFALDGAIMKLADVLDGWVTHDTDSFGDINNKELIQFQIGLYDEDENKVYTAYIDIQTIDRFVEVKVDRNMKQVGLDNAIE